ncbi:hypothetical protein DIPPA_17228 [Diplonema papillatum]|nr:hypothetical protein DIPPA_17228 [Diplonema papillatum]
MESPVTFKLERTKSCTATSSFGCAEPPGELGMATVASTSTTLTATAEATWAAGVKLVAVTSAENPRSPAGCSRLGSTLSRTKVVPFAISPNTTP